MAAMNDSTAREGIRTSLQLWLNKLSCGGNAVEQLEHKKRFLSKLGISPICLASPESLEQHYEVPTTFFRLILGPRMKYSCNLHDLDADESLDDLAAAEQRSLETICLRAEIRDGMDVLDLGCGWGALTLFLLENYPNCRVVSVSNSATQRAHIESEAARIPGAAARLSVVTLNVADFHPGRGIFDRVVSIEMLEHMKNVQELFSRISLWLKPDGKLFSQILCHRQFSYNFDSRRNSDTEWMAKHFFTGGSMFSADLFLHLQTDLQLLNMWLVNGKHYSRTLEAWLRKLDSVRVAAKISLGDRLSDAQMEEQLTNWRLFFIFCSEVFAFDGGNQWLVAHHLFRKRESGQQPAML